MPPSRSKKVKVVYSESEAEDESEHSGSEDGDDLLDPPTDIDPYKTLAVDHTATPTEIRTAYRKLALKHHPDKVSESEKSTAHTTFQSIAFAYAILSDEGRRARYDATGRTDEKGEDDEDFDWAAFYKELNEELVTGTTLKQFKATYQGSEEERTDLLNAYTRYKGRLGKIFDTVMLSEVLEDEERFRVIIDKAIEEGEVEAYTYYTEESEASKLKRRKSAEKEGKEAMDYAKKLGVYDELFGDDKGAKEEDPGEGVKAKKTKAKKKKDTNPEDDPNHPLAALIRGRQQSRGMDFLSNLEAKYAGGISGKKRHAGGGPSEAEFLETRKKVDSGRGPKKTKR